MSDPATATLAGRRPRRTQAERREEAERLILEAATRLVAERGLDGFTLADAAELAGYSRGLPAHYFRSKSDLLAAIAAHIRRWFFDGLSSHVKGRQRGLDNLIAAIDFYFDACGTDRSMMVALHTVLSGALHKPLLAPSIAQFNRDSAELTEAAIRAGISNGEIRRGVDAKAWSILILTSVRGIIAQWLVDPEHIDLPALRSNLVAAIKRNFAP